MPASLRLVYNAGSLGGSQVAAAVRYTILAKQAMARVIALGDSVSANGATPANLENSAEFGVQKVPVAQGAAFQAALVAINAVLATITDAQLAALDQD